MDDLWDRNCKSHKKGVRTMQILTPYMNLNFIYLMRSTLLFRNASRAAPFSMPF